MNWSNPILWVLGGSTVTAAADIAVNSGRLTAGIMNGLLDSFTTGGHHLIDMVLTGLNIPQASYTWLTDIADLVGYFLPLDIAVTLIVAYIGFVSVFIGVKMALKVIPWIG